MEARITALAPSTICICRPADDCPGLRPLLRIVRALPWDAEAAGLYADIRHQLATGGRPMGELDMMIAAHALSVGAVLVTNNTRHFG